MNTKLRMVIKGLATWIPGADRFFSHRAGATESARYCYSVWLRHLVMAEMNGLSACPKVVAELGPGNSIGVGIAALLSGSEQYIGLDVAEFAGKHTNLSVFEELVKLFKDRAPIPGDEEYPGIKPRLESYNFPCHILREARLKAALEESRLFLIREWIADVNGKDSQIKYVAPWYNQAFIGANSVDCILSQAVLEHVQDLAFAYRVMKLWLKPTGFISHTIDYKCHGTAEKWNGHWYYSDLTWRLMKGKRVYFLNREPHSTHIKLLGQEGYSVVLDRRYLSESELPRHGLTRRYKSMSEEDLVTSEGFVQATKVPSDQKAAY